MDRSELIRAAMPLVMDAKYLAESMDRFHGCGEVRISERGAKVMLANYQRLIEAVSHQGRGDATAEVIEHPTVAEATRRRRWTNSARSRWTGWTSSTRV